jgi:hypothetical protein
MSGDSARSGLDILRPFKTVLSRGPCYKPGYGIFLGPGKMYFQPLSRFGLALFVFALVSGCASTSSAPAASGQAEASSKAAAATSTPTAVQCKTNRSKCLYEGAYEPGERGYAEQEAKRLNLAELQRLRRSMGN